MRFLLRCRVLFLVLATRAHAGFFIEPNVGYTAGTLNQSRVPAISLQALVLGGRLGFRVSDFNFGADSSIGIGKASQIDNTGDYKPTDLGFFLGYDLPLSLSAYGSVFIISKAKIQSSENPSYFSGQSFRVGLEWSGLNFCSINFEGTYRIYSQYAGVKMTKSLRGTTLGASVSVPFP